MKVKFLKSGAGYGFGYVKGTIVTIHDSKKAKELIDKGVCKAAKEEVKEVIKPKKEVERLIPPKKRRRKKI